MMTEGEIECNKQQKSRLREEIVKFLAERDGFVPLEEIAEHLELPLAKVKEYMISMERVNILYPFFPILSLSEIGKLMGKDGKFKLATMKDIEEESVRLADISLKLREFFDANPENYYTLEEICESTGLCRDDVIHELSRMEILTDYYSVASETADSMDYYRKSAPGRIVPKS